MSLLAFVLVVVVVLFNVVMYSGQLSNIQSTLDYATTVGPEGMHAPNIGGFADRTQMKEFEINSGSSVRVVEKDGQYIIESSTISMGELFNGDSASQKTDASMQSVASNDDAANSSSSPNTNTDANDANINAGDGSEPSSATDATATAEANSDALAAAQELASDVSSAKGYDSSIPVVCVMVDNNTGLIVTTSDTVEIDDQVLYNAVADVMQKGDGFGELSNLGLFYSSHEEIGHTVMAFADSSNFHSEVNERILYSAIACVVILAILLAIALGLSRFALRPVKEAWSGQQRFIADASHELKTPLTVILANNDIINAHPEATIAEEQRWIDSTHEEALKMQNLVRDLLILAQTEPDNVQAFRANLQLEVVDFSGLVEKDILQFEAVAFDKGVELVDDIEQGLNVEADSEKLERVVRVLLDNSCKYAGAVSDENDGSETDSERATNSNGDERVLDGSESECDQAPEDEHQVSNEAAAKLASVWADSNEENQNTYNMQTSAIEDDEAYDEYEDDEFVFNSDKVVRVSLKRERSNAVLRVNNMGSVIDPEDLPHIFEKFYRSNKARTGSAEGFGLGLSIAYNIVKNFGGSISVTSNAQDGTTFIVKLPLK